MANGYTVISIDNFRKELKALSRKHPSILEDMLMLIGELQVNHTPGPSLGIGFYKIRLAITSKGSGKSGGARVIINVKVVNKVVYLVTIYDKSNKNTVSAKELRDFLKLLP